MLVAVDWTGMGYMNHIMDLGTSIEIFMESACVIAVETGGGGRPSQRLNLGL